MWERTVYLPCDITHIPECYRIRILCPYWSWTPYVDEDTVELAPFRLPSPKCCGPCQVSWAMGFEVVGMGRGEWGGGHFWNWTGEVQIHLGHPRTPAAQILLVFQGLALANHSIMGVSWGRTFFNYHMFLSFKNEHSLVLYTGFFFKWQNSRGHKLLEGMIWESNRMYF